MGSFQRVDLLIGSIGPLCGPAAICNIIPDRSNLLPCEQMRDEADMVIKRWETSSNLVRSKIVSIERVQVSHRAVKTVVAPHIIAS